MTRKVHRLEVRPFHGLKDGEKVVWEGHRGLRFKGLFAGWGGEVVVTNRRVIFKAATWEFARQEIRSVEVEPLSGWFVRYVVGGLAWLIDSIIFWLEDPRKWPRQSISACVTGGRWPWGSRVVKKLWSSLRRFKGKHLLRAPFKMRPGGGAA